MPASRMTQRGRRDSDYEVCCWRGGSIPDLGDAVGGPRRLSSDPRAARRVLDLVVTVPTPVWGRDELNAGEMWNSNSVTAWLIAAAGLSTDPLDLRSAAVLLVGTRVRWEAVP